MKEETKKLVDILNELAYKYKLNIQANKLNLSMGFTFHEEQVKNNETIPAKVNVSVTETETANGSYWPFEEVHFFVKPLKPLKEKNAKSIALSNFDFLRGSNFGDKKIKVFTNRHLDEKERSTVNGLREMGVNIEVVFV
jgi:hypothetical protein